MVQPTGCAKPTWQITPPCADAWWSNRTAGRCGRTSPPGSTANSKKTGHVNAAFPTLIPLSFFEKEKNTSKASRLNWQLSPTAAAWNSKKTGGAPHLRDHHRSHVCQVDQILARPAHSHRAMGFGTALGTAHQTLPAHSGVLLARRSHRARQRRRSQRRDVPHPRYLRKLLSRRSGDPSHQRHQERDRTFSPARRSPPPSKR
jgi:hypothetical protein